MEVEGEDENFEPFQEEMMKPKDTKIEEPMSKPSIWPQKQPEMPLPQENKE